MNSLLCHLLFWLLRQTQPTRKAHRFLPSLLKNKIVQTQARITRENFRIIGDAPDGDMRGKIVAYLFAGRRDRMEILLGYLDELLAKKQIDALHIWNITRNDGDRNWVRGLACKEGYRVMECARGEWWSMYKSQKNKIPPMNALFKIAHNYYAHSRYDGCGLLKIDDDVVFVDTPRFGIFRAALLRLAAGEMGGGCHMISANVVNGYMGDYLNQRDGVIPVDVAEIALPLRFPLAKSKGEETYWNRGRKSQALHEFFLANPARFLRPDAENADIEPDKRFTINFVGLTNAVLPIPFTVVNDELYLSWELPPEKYKGIQMIRGFTVAHLSFGSQPEQDDAGLVVKYRELQKRAPFMPQTDK